MGTEQLLVVIGLSICCSAWVVSLSIEKLTAAIEYQTEILRGRKEK